MVEWLVSIRQNKAIYVILALGCGVSLQSMAYMPEHPMGR